MTQETQIALEGVRIADLTIITAGACATQLLADLGAEVVKVESGAYPDPFRTWRGAPQGDVSAASSPTFAVVNRNKRGVCLDLKHERGREAFLRLVARSDAVTENFRAGVLERLGLDFPRLQAANPRIILLSLSSQGHSGPESGYGSYGSTLDALSGLMSVTGYEDGLPLWSGPDVNYPDQVAALFGAGLLLAALRHRDRVGSGCHVDLSQRELVTTMIGEWVLERTLGGVAPRQKGNRRQGFAPNDCYRCAGEDSWVAISIAEGSAWRSLCEVIGRPELADDPLYRTPLARLRNDAGLRPVIEGWTLHQTKQEAARRLQSAGIRAAPVQNGADMLSDEHLNTRGYYVDPDRSGLRHLRLAPYRLSDTPSRIWRHAPELGQDTDSVLADLLGYSPAEIRELGELGVTRSTTPAERSAPGHDR